MSAALPTRILRLVASKPDGMTPREILDAFPAYTQRAREAAIERLVAARCVGAISVGGVGRWSVTGLGLAAIANGKSPRWTERRS